MGTRQVGYYFSSNPAATPKMPAQSPMAASAQTAAALYETVETRMPASGLPVSNPKPLSAKTSPMRMPMTLMSFVSTATHGDTSDRKAPEKKP